MLLTSSPRRALGLLAVGTIGMSTALFSVGGVASAAETSWTFSTDATADVDQPGIDLLEIKADPAARCLAVFQLEGAAGGAGVSGQASALGNPGGSVTGEHEVGDGDVFELEAGTVGGDGVDGVFGLGGSNGHGYDGRDGTEDNAIYGGGGGGASTITRFDDNAVILGAIGGDGAYAQVGSASGQGGYAGNTAGQNTLHADGVSGTPSNTGAGVISGTVTCVTKDPIAPGVPTLDSYVQAGDGTATFRFTPGSAAFDSTDHQVAVSYEYQLDGGTWTAFTHGWTNNDDLTGTLTGLTNLKKYSLAVRATSAAGDSAASAPVSFTPYRAVPAPASVSAAVGASSLRVSWVPAADSAGTVSYEAFASPDGAQSSQDTVICTTATTTCALGVKPGIAYTFGVVGIDALGNYGRPIFGEKATELVPAVAIAATLPKADGTLTSSAADGKVAAGAQVTVSGKDFLPGSTVEIVVYSTPVKLGSVVVLADGTFTTTVTLPANLTNGVHNLVASGVDVNGNARNLVVEVTVSGGTAVLANTGFSALPFVGAGALALLAGGGLLVAARRRQAA